MEKAERSANLTLAEYEAAFTKEQRGEDLEDWERAGMEQRRAAMEHTGAVVNAALEKLGGIVGPIADAFSRVRDEVQRISAEVVTFIAEVPATLRSASIALAHQGWYLDPESGLSDARVYERMIALGELDELDGAISADIEHRLTSIEEYLVAEFPRRERVLRAAFRAHRAADFELSVPVFLIQADGACVDAREGSLFMREKVKNGALEVAAKIRAKSEDEFTSAATAALFEKLPLVAGKEDRANALKQSGETEWLELNRHLVLHGESVDYGTQMNSLKAISLLSFIAGFVKPSPLDPTAATAAEPPVG